MSRPVGERGPTADGSPAVLRAQRGGGFQAGGAATVAAYSLIMSSWRALHVLQLQSLLLMLHAGNLRVTRLYLTPRLVALISDRLHLQVHRMQAVPSFDQLRGQVLQRRGRCLWGMATQLELGRQGVAWLMCGATHRHGAKANFGGKIQRRTRRTCVRKMIGDAGRSGA